MTTDPEPFEEGQRAAREKIPAEGNPYQDGSQEHALWAAGHEEAAGEIEAGESEDNLSARHLRRANSRAELHSLARSKRSLRRASCAGFLARGCDAPLTLRGALRPSDAERPVLLFHLDKTDEHVLEAEIQALMQSRRNGLVEGALLIDRSTFVKRQLNNHAVL